jgi:zinc D-Ala-D-Ala dipeptidase
MQQKSLRICLCGRPCVVNGVGPSVEIPTCKTCCHGGEDARLCVSRTANDWASSVKTDIEQDSGAMSREGAESSRLRPVTGVLCHLKYVDWNYPGAIEHPWLQGEVIGRLWKADRRIRHETNGRGRLLIWDALRSFPTQEFLFRKERSRIAEVYPGALPSQVDAIVSTIVRPPLLHKPPPHTTGGAVDVTIWIDDTEQALGGFDDFTPFGGTNYFSLAPPQSSQEIRTATLRSLLRDAMTAEDFVGIDTEWWHFEFGTRYWAATKRCTVLFDAILQAPETDSIAVRASLTPTRQPQFSTGAAQVFSTAADRGRSLRGEIPGHHYARTRHPNERQVAKQLGAIVGGEDAILCPSGLSAIVTTVWAYIPPGGRILLDKHIYYESMASIRELGIRLNWEVTIADLSDSSNITSQKLWGIDAILVDHPCNWILSCPRLTLLKETIDHSETRLIVDTSIQPLQRLLELGLADLVVLSLSKYPSFGMTIGGAIIGSNSTLAPIRKLNAVLGSALAPEAAATVLHHLPSLTDRMETVSERARRVAAFLREIPFVSDVSLPDLGTVEALPGGQITFMVTPEIADRAEAVVAANAMDPSFPLAFACTFGTSFTTFEHFDSRNNTTCHPSTGSAYIEPGRIRLGIGHESTDRLIEGLRFVLLAAQSK